MTERVEIADWYDEESSKYYERRFGPKHGYYKMQVIQRKLLDSIKPSKVLELGAGTGRHVIFLSKLGLDVTGIDLSEDMLGECRKRADELNLEPELHQMDAHDLKFPNDSFDTVYCDRAFKFFDNPRKVLDEVRRVLKPGGKFIAFMVSPHMAARRSKGRNSVIGVLDYFYEWLKFRFRCMNREKIPFREHSDLIGTGYSQDFLKKILRESGFRVKSMEYVFNLFNFMYKIIPEPILYNLLFPLDSRFNIGWMEAK